MNHRLESFLADHHGLRFLSNFAGSTEEKEIDSLGEGIKKLLGRLYVGKKYEEGWKQFDTMKAEFTKRVENYHGNRSGYFKNMLEEIKEQEREALGYRLHSN